MGHRQSVDSYGQLIEGITKKSTVEGDPSNITVIEKGSTFIKLHKFDILFNIFEYYSADRRSCPIDFLERSDGHVETRPLNVF